MKNIEYVLQLEAITPLHVGSGKLFKQGIDFDVFRQQVTIYNSNKIHSRLAKSEKTVIQEYEEELREKRPSLYRFFKSISWDEKEFIRSRFSITSHSVRDIKEQMKTGFGIPIIPGSSLKGAMRTAILANFFDVNPQKQEDLFEKRNSKNKQKADEEILHQIFGKDPNSDVVRQIIVGDIPFKKEDLGFSELKVANLTNTGWGFLNMRNRKTENPRNWKFATTIIIENIKAGAISEPFNLIFDDFLNDHSNEIFDAEAIPLGGKFLGIVEWFFKREAEREYEFYLKHDMQKTAKFYKDYIINRKFSDEEVLVRIGWGGGWKFMTGDWLESEQIKIIRREYNLGRKGHNVFPKSRRLMIQDNFPYVPIGWAVLHIL